jgi:hypothetical protein
MTATRIRTLESFRGNAALYRVEPPMKGAAGWGDEGPTVTYPYVIVSAAHVPYSGPETYIFGATEQGEVADWLELPGSYRGRLDHAEALTAAGYAIAD